MPPPPPGTPPPPGGGPPPGPPGGSGGPGGAPSRRPGEQLLVFRVVNAGGVSLSNAELLIERQPGQIATVSLRDDGLTPLDQPSDGVLVGVHSGPYVRLLRGELWVDQPTGRAQAWQGVLSVPDRDTDGAAFALQVRDGAVVARPMVAFPAGDAVAGLVGGYPLAGVTFWALFVLALSATLVVLRWRAPAPDGAAGERR